MSDRCARQSHRHDTYFSHMRLFKGPWNNLETSLKAIFLYRTHPNFVEIHFSRELPVFPKHRRQFRQPMPKVMLSRSVDLDYISDLLMDLNAGNFCVELDGHRRAFREFLADLVFLEGVEMIVDVERFTLTVRVGRCFDAGSVCQSIAKCVHQHFYSSEQLVCESELASRETAPNDGDAPRQHGRNSPARK